MRPIKNFVLMLTGILGASAGIILLALINNIGDLGLSFSHVFIYGLTAGVLCGWITAVVLFFIVKKWIRKKIHYHTSKLFNRPTIKSNKYFGKFSGDVK